MKMKILMLCLLPIATLRANISIDNQSPNTTFVDKVTLLTYNGLDQIPHIKEINLPIVSGQRIDKEKLVGNTTNPIVQVILVHNNITYSFHIPANAQSGNIVVTQDNQVTSDGAIQLAEKRETIPHKERDNWGIRRL